MVKAIEHITITTGATRMSARSEVNDETVRHRQRAIAEGSPLGYNWTYQAQPLLGCTQAWVFDVVCEGAPVVRSWLCADGKQTDAMLARASEEPIDERVVLHRPRGVPWLACALLPGALSAGPEILMMVGDLERCVAWALLEV